MIFRPLSAESYGVEQNPSFLATFFSSACNFGRNVNRLKILADQISKYTRDSQKHFHASGTNIGEIIWGPWGGTPVPPLTNPNPDFVEVCARRLKIFLMILVLCILN